MSACPEQNSMVSAGTSMAVVGGPAAGSQRRGLAIFAVPASYLPQAMIFPVGRRLMCRGTMSQLTGASHWPVVASGGSAPSVMVDDVAVTAPVV